MLQLLFNTRVGFGKLSTVHTTTSFQNRRLDRSCCSVLLSMMFGKIAYSTNVSSFSYYCWFVNVRRSCMYHECNVSLCTAYRKNTTFFQLLSLNKTCLGAPYHFIFMLHVSKQVLWNSIYFFAKNLHTMFCIKRLPFSIKIKIVPQTLLPLSKKIHSKSLLSR